MRNFRPLSDEEIELSEIIFTDDVAEASDGGNVGVAVLYDDSICDAVSDLDLSFIVFVHEEISHISTDEARTLRDALTEALDG